MAATAWPTIALGATPPGPTSLKYSRRSRPRVCTRSLWRTVSLSQRTTPSTSEAESPASARAARAASVANESTLRPDRRGETADPPPGRGAAGRGGGGAGRHGLPWGGGGGGGGARGPP